MTSPPTPRCVPVRRCRAIDRYTGVVYDALDAGSLDHVARRWLGRHVLIHRGRLGPVGALDKIPTYRLGATAALPGLPPLRRVWAEAVGAALLARADPFVLDLRSEAYVALGPVPEAIPSAYVRVVGAGDDGTVRALNHFNKASKGRWCEPWLRLGRRSAPCGACCAGPRRRASP